MGVVNLDDVLFVEILQCAVGGEVARDDGLHGSRHEEILLFETQRLALIMVVFRVENLGNRLRHSLLFRGFEVFAPCEEVHIDALHGPGVPQAQRVDVFRPVSGDYHVTGHG